MSALDDKRGGPDQVPVTAPDPFPPADDANKAPITGEGWIEMIRRRKRVEQQ